MFFGGVSGLNAFFPVIIKDNLCRPPIVITDFLLIEKSKPQSVQLKWQNEDSPLIQAIHVTEEVILRHKHNVFSFEFSALHYASPRKNQYEYKVEGWDREWIKTDWKNRRITYTNLPARDYVFKVRGSNKDEIWKEESTNIAGRI